MGLGRKIKKSVGKFINKITGGNDTLNKILGVTLAIPTGGASLAASKKASDMLLRQAEKKEAGIRAGIQAAEEAAENQIRQKEYSDFERKIIGQRSQRLENALQSKTDFTSEEDVDPRDSRVEKLLAKKRKLIGFE